MCHPPVNPGAVLLLVTLLACGDSGTGVNTGPQSLTGKWHGSTSGTDLDFTLTENTGGQVHGTGQLSGYASGILVDATGSHTGTGFTITLSHTGYQSATYAGGMVNDSTLGGAINGSGFSNFFITLYRR